MAVDNMQRNAMRQRKIFAPEVKKAEHSGDHPYMFVILGGRDADREPH